MLATALLALQLPAAAEDIDLFAPLPRDESGRPNVLIILDNTANWNTAFTNEIAALVDTFDGLPLDEFNVGLMFFGAPETGYIRAAIRPMDATNRPLYSAMIGALHRTNDSGNARTLARTFSEAYRYLNGLDSVAPSVMTGSPHTTKRDFRNNTAGNAQTTPCMRAPAMRSPTRRRTATTRRSTRSTAPARSSSTSATPCRAATW